MSLRGAVVGVGYLGNFHAQKYRDLCQGTFKGKIDFVGVCDVREEQVKKVAGELGVKSFLRPQDLIGQVDLVTIATITSSHHETARFFLQNGVHVNVEKPITVTVAEAKELIDLARTKKLQLCVGHSERFNPAYRRVKPELKNIQHVDLQRHASYKSRGADVSVVHDLMIHDIDLALNLIPGNVRVVSARGGKVISKTLDWANAELEFSAKDGFVASAQISVSRMAPQMTRILKVVADNGVHEVNFQTADWSHLVPQSPTSSEPGFQVSQQNCGKSDNLMLETQAYFSAVLDEAPAAITGEDGMRALSIVDEVMACIERSQHGRMK